MLLRRKTHICAAGMLLHFLGCSNRLGDDFCHIKLLRRMNAEKEFPEELIEMIFHISLPGLGIICIISLSNFLCTSVVVLQIHSTE